MRSHFTTSPSLGSEAPAMFGNQWWNVYSRGLQIMKPECFVWTTNKLDKLLNWADKSSRSDLNEFYAKWINIWPKAEPVWDNEPKNLSFSHKTSHTITETVPLKFQLMSRQVPLKMWISSQVESHFAHCGIIITSQVPYWNNVLLTVEVAL